MKQTFYPLCLALGLLATACSSDSPTLPDNQPENALKTPITFSSGVAGGSVGRATVITGGGGFTYNAFAANTGIVMNIVSQKGSDATYRSTRTVAKTQASSSDENNILFESNDVRYWDDAFGRSAKMSVYAVAVPEKALSTGSTGLTKTSLTGFSGTEGAWQENSIESKIIWTVSTTQNTTTIGDEDLVYSNNVQNGNRIGFTPDVVEAVDGPGTFGTGPLKFNHALTRITVKLKEGTGFNNSSNDDFQFDSGKEIELLGMPYKGTLDVATGTWSSTSPTNVKTAKQSTTESGVNYMRSAQVLPDYTITKDDNTNMMKFTIDGNTYYVTQAMVFTALKTPLSLGEDVASITMEQGKNYIFTLTVKKTGITLTANVAEWQNVTATEEEVENANGRTMDFYTAADGSACNSFDLYRLVTNTENSTTATWGGNYTEKFSTKDKTIPDDGQWTTGWYFETSNSYYHFRTVNVGTTLQESETENPDYFTITSGALNNDPSSGNDYHWGAPIKKEASNIQHDPDKGYEDYISPAINATVSPIGITEFHTMSDIHVVLKTTDGDDAVKLFDDSATPKYTKITLMRYYNTGTVLMGNGKVEPNTTTDATNSEITAPSENNSGDYYETDPTKSKAYTYRVVPQPLDYNNGADQHIGLEILTPDGNKYFINQLSDIKVQGKENKIDRWYPGKKYTYTFKLKKTGIQMTCTVANWQNITASDTNVDLTK